MAIAGRTNVTAKWIKPWVFLLSLLPAGVGIGAIFLDQLGTNPAETLIRGTGDWALRFLCLALAVTPLRWITGWSRLAQLRRMVGLFCFFYASCHALAYAWLDMGFEVPLIAADIAKRPFILVGVGAWCVLFTLAVTSSAASVRWLGAKRWQRLHKAVYGVAGLAILHFFWMRAAKNSFVEPAWYGSILAGLLLVRLARNISNWLVSRTDSA